MSGLIGVASALVVVMVAAAVRPRPVRRLPPARAGAVRARTGWVSRHARGVRPLGTTLALVVSVAVLGLVPTAVVVVGRLGGLRLARIRAARRRRARVDAELPDAIESFVHAVHAGLTPRQAVERLASAAPPAIRPGFAAVVDRMGRGDAFADALRGLDDTLGPPTVVVSTLVASADRDGLPLGPVLAQLAAESRAARRRSDEAAARSLPVKLSFPLVACTLPSFVLLAIVPAVLAALSSLGDAW